MGRSFQATTAARERVPLLVGLVGPSGSGKTYSMLRLATGIQRETGGDIYVIDTEARRSLHYADHFQFKHLDFRAPFGPADYLAAIQHCAAQGAKVICVDSMSHEHEGQGGLLEMHEAEVQRLAGDDYKKQERVKFLAWVKPKHERQRLISGILQLPVNFIFCFRAKEKLKLIPGKDPINLGWQAIAGDEFIYEQTLALLLPPGSQGVPDLAPAEVGEKALVKVPRQFQAVIQRGKPLTEEVGKQLADWAAGAPSAPSAAPGATKPTKADLLLQLSEILAKAPDQPAKKALLAVGFGGFGWKQVQEASESNLVAGLAKIRKHLDEINRADLEAVDDCLDQDQVFTLLGLARREGLDAAAIEDHVGMLLNQIPASRYEELVAWLGGVNAVPSSDDGQGSLSL